MAEEARMDTENRLLAALAHGSIMAQGLGVVAGIVIYLTQREKSRFVALQALQAAVFQVIALILVIGSWLVWGVFYAITWIPLMNIADDAAPPPIFWIGIISMVIPFIVMIVIGLYGLIGAVQVWRGKDFRYLFIGRWLERSGLFEQPSED
nr:DUF4870 domain-containing protein [Anaerolineae bacterium]